MSEDGPDLKTAISSHAITIINSTMSIITGGNTSIPDITSETWYYNHETKTFTSGPKLMKARRSHGSATIIDKTTKEKNTGCHWRLLWQQTFSSNGFNRIAH